MHQYLDSDGSGTNATCVSSTIGADRLQAATQWLQQNNLKGFLGEIGAGSNCKWILHLLGLKLLAPGDTTTEIPGVVQEPPVATQPVERPDEPEQPKPKEYVDIFFIGQNENHEEVYKIVKREYDEGHFLASHGYSHIYSQLYYSPQSVLDEYNKCIIWPPLSPFFCSAVRFVRFCFPETSCRLYRE